MKETSAHTELKPEAFYTAREAATLLRLSRVDSIYEIPEAELPRCRVGPSRGSVRFYGADLLAYAKGLVGVDYQDVITRLKDRLINSPSSGQPNQPSSSRRRIV